MASALILLPFYVTYLSTSDFGALSIYFGFLYFVQLLTTYSFDTSLYIHFHEFKHDHQKLSSFVSSSFIFMLFIGLGVGLICSLFGELLFSNIFAERSVAFQSHGFMPYGFMAALAGIFQSLFKVHNNLLQSREKPEIYMWANVISFGIIALVTIIGLKLYPGTLLGPIGGRLLAAVFSGSWALWRIFKEFGMRFDFPLIRGSFSFNFYTFLYQLLQWVINYFDRMFMAFFLVLSSVGVYNFAFQCLLVIEFVLNGLHSSFYPKVVSTVISQDSKGSTLEINRYYNAFIGVILVVICCCILAFPYAIELLVKNPDYVEAIPYIPYIAVIYIFRAVRLFYAAPYGILKYTKPLSLIYLAVSAVKIFVMWILIGRLEIYAVIIASMVAAVLEIILLRSGLRGRFTFRYNPFKILVAPAVLFVLIIVAEPLFAGAAPFMTHALYLALCVALLLWIYRNEVKLINPFDILR